MSFILKSLLYTPKVKRGANCYYLIRNENYTLNHSFLGWRIVYFILRLFNFTKILTYYYARIAFLSEYGLKGLFWCTEYHLDYSVDKVGNLQKDINK